MRGMEHNEELSWYMPPCLNHRVYLESQSAYLIFFSPYVFYYLFDYLIREWCFFIHVEPDLQMFFCLSPSRFPQKNVLMCLWKACPIGILASVSSNSNHEKEFSDIPISAQVELQPPNPLPWLKTLRPLKAIGKGCG